MSSTATNQLVETLASYEDVAVEYYDGDRHPTCRDLRELSQRFLVAHIRAGFSNNGSLIEVGPGRSILAPEAAAAGVLSRVVLIDSSPSMLSYSTPWITGGAHAVAASADATDLPSGTVSLIVSSLGDPYNCSEFWQEVARLITPDGSCLFTTPSFEWSASFRPRDNREVAEFLRADGARLFMPSRVYQAEEQIAMIEAAGLMVEERQGLNTKMLNREPAPKLRCIDSTCPVVSAYVVRLPR
ncbi:MAG: methyltransferase domain-containing protein [Bradyrhizobium sp.]|uniref:methyltransferase domain-containing protein n=1 Tax=Bradyrhizobium sp. TaxID=376 RepID=UPI001224249F|nr:MAG: methyltransferase domain-containing protein [Bradyrhizobium sp.]